MEFANIHIANWLRIINQRKALIFYCFSAVFLSTLLFTFLQRPIYSAEAKVRIWWTRNVGEFIMWRDWGEGVDVGEEVRFMRSPQFAQEVAKRTGAEFRDEEGAFPEHLSFQRIENSNIIVIYTSSSSAEDAARLANIAAEAYVELKISERRAAAGERREEAEEHMREFGEKLDTSDIALKEFKENEGELIVRKVYLQKELVILDFERTEFLQRYARDNQEVRAVEKQIENAQNELKSLASKEVELVRLKRDQAYNQKKFSQWQERSAGVGITEDDQAPDVSIVERAIAPRFPSSPNFLYNGLMGALVGLMFGGFVAFFAENVQGSVSTIEEIESFVGIPAVGVIPYLTLESENFWRKLSLFRGKRNALDDMKKRLISNYSPQSYAQEAYRRLALNLQASVISKGAKILVITSAGPSEGKTITCANLAIVQASAGSKVLLMGTDLRKPMLHALFDLPRNPGLVECISKTAKWKEVMRDSGFKNLKIITSGAIPTNPAEILDAPGIYRIMRECQEHFDLVICDSPPLLPITDAAILGPKADGVILVYQLEKTAKEALRRAKEQMESMGAFVRGIVINTTAPEMRSYLYYPRYPYKRRVDA